MFMILLPYRRQQAVAYAHYWAYRRNPSYYDFEAIGGDCTNFVSQCIFEIQRSETEFLQVITLR